MARQHYRRQKLEASVDVEAALTLLGDEYVQEIFAVLREEPATAREITDRCSGSKVTIYRRLNDLADAGLVNSEPQISPDGNHCKRYRAVVDELTISLTGDGFEATVEA
ncbi:winged helix-turn-helix transcriptional regulator [Natronolimnobius sp. AArcel1]|uniref:ArsR/SmtB family transcription factor n=1 Tax=Natronolimnobius sp. AArcel1 TaxID=1679093 RepID=UPI0013EE1229|nr:winged helix-turn-helix domain-containing protein [Natronolimnobius sp. AArcel1]NGM68706.1 winged helix-turn-helix transcriptional regulator [Natronolimnobius sp. AArcel1]